MKMVILVLHSSLWRADESADFVIMVKNKKNLKRRPTCRYKWCILIFLFVCVWFTNGFVNKWVNTTLYMENTLYFYFREFSISRKYCQKKLIILVTRSIVMNREVHELLIFYLFMCLHWHIKLGPLKTQIRGSKRSREHWNIW